MTTTSRPLDHRTDSRREALSYCRDLAGSHYENFTVVLPGLPEDIAQDLANVYAFARWADDLADESPTGEVALERLTQFESMLETTYEEGDHSHPVFKALAVSIDRRGYEPRHFRDLLSAFKQDQNRQTYDTFRELIDYCERSANPVGRLVLETFDRHTEECRYYADKTCTALQLTNFWADVPIDYDKNRIYIPREDRDRFDVAESDLRESDPGSSFRNLMAFEVERTRDWFRVGWSLVDRVGGPLALCVELFNAGGWAVLDAIEEHDYNVLERRRTLDTTEKVLLGLRGLWRWASGVSVPPT
jgi:squalene synthase HpnC